MPQTAQCPSCGASVAFRSNVSILAVCEYCRTTLLNVDGKVENLGKMAELAQDRSRLQVGAQGIYRQKPFTIAGRIQLQYGQGLWNEWFLLFDDQSTGWLSEAAGAYSLSFQRFLKTGAPAFSELRPGSRLRLSNAEWTVTNIERATCVAGEGELPFKVGGGYPAPVVDLRSSATNAFITLDYSEDEKNPLLFVGESVDFSSLKWRNLREDNPFPTGPKLRAKALLCQNCGAQLEIKHEDILSIGCAHCGRVTDAKTEKLIEKVSLAYKSQKVVPLIPIGHIGVLRGEKLEVIGFMQRYMIFEGMRYFWREYLLARVGSPGYRWLTESDGHWSMVDVVEDVPRVKGNSRCDYRKQSFKHFQSYKGVVDYVIGEFTWRVIIGETVDLDDYVAPPFSLSREKTSNEISWSFAEYVPSQEIAVAFNIKKPPKPRGIYLNQPNPKGNKVRPVWMLFFGFVLLSIALQTMFSLSSNSPDKAYANHNVTMSGGEHFLSPPFDLSETSNLEIKSRIKGLDNEWVELGLALVRETDGEIRYGTTELSYYSGIDPEDGSWSENRLNRTLLFNNMPPGVWRLLADRVDSNRDTFNPINVHLTINQSRASKWNFILLLFTLFVWPVVLSYKYFTFEVARWKEGDHPIFGDD